jgi:hypothetical protein
MRIILAIAFWVALIGLAVNGVGCNATERSALRDCAMLVIPNQVIATLSECGVEDRKCIEDVSRQRALIAAEYINVCLEGKREHLPNTVQDAGVQ